MTFDVEKCIEPYLGDEYYFDEEAALKPIAFIENYCRVTKDGALFNAGDLMKVVDWQKDLIIPTFGIKRKEDGFRRFQYVWCEIPKKNGKSGLLSALSLYLLGIGGVAGSEGFGAANTKTQAGIILEDAKEMIRLDPHLSRAYTIQQYKIKYEKTNSVYQTVAAEAKGIHGINPTFVFYDEIHAEETLDKRVQDLWDALRKSFVTRAEPLLFSITNSGVKETFPHKLHLRAKDIQRGVIKDDRWFVKTYNLPDDADIYDEESFNKVNPAYGETIPKRYWEDLVNEMRTDPMSESVNRRLHFGQWVSSTSSWDIANKWDRGFHGVKTIEDFKGNEAIIAWDMSQTRDFTSAAIIIPPPIKRQVSRYTEAGEKIGEYEVEVFQGNTAEKYEVFVLTWLPRSMEAIKQFQQTIEFDQWVSDGYVRLTEGDTVDSHRVARDIIEACVGLDVIQGGFDRRDADTVYRVLLDTYGDIFFPQIQNAAHMNVAVKALEGAVRNGEISHQGNPLLSWQIGNVELWEDSSGYRWVHKTKSRDKIDGIVAILNGFKCIEEIIAGAKPKINYSELIV